VSKLSYKTLFIIFFFLLIGVVVLSKFVFPNQKVSAAWWNDMWQYRKAISISNTSGSDQSNMVVKINIDTSTLISVNKMQSTCNDIRITDFNSNILQHYVTQCNTSSTNIYAKIPNTPSSGSGIYIYYGNPTADNIENNSIFTYFDDFESGITQDTWATNNISIGITSGFANKGNYSQKFIAQGSSYDTLTQTFSTTHDWTNQYLEYEFYTDVANSWWMTDPRNSSGTRMNSWNTFAMTAFSWLTFSKDLNTNTYVTDIKSVFYATQSDDINRNIFIDNFRIRNCLSTVTTGSPQSEEVSTGPIAYWKFDNNELGGNYTQLNYVTINNNVANGYLNSINTNVPYNNATKLEFTIKSTDTVSYIMLVSGYSSSTARAYPCILGSSYISPSSFTTSTLTPSNITRSQVSDGTTRTFTLDFTSSSNYPISFGSWSDVSWSRTIDWYSFKIWNSNTLIRNFIPVKKNSNSAIGFLDTVNDVFYPNTSTGTFTAGPEITYDSVGNNNGTLGAGTSAPTYLSEDQCVSGKCLSFNGTSDYVQLSTVNDVKSISMWTFINSTQNAGWRYLLDARDGSANGYFANFGIGSDWTKMYVNGISKTVSWDNIPKDQWVHLYLEANNTFNDNINLMSRVSNNENLTGKLDEVKLYPYARTADQIKLDYNSRGSSKGSSVNIGVKSNTNPSLKSKLIAYYKFDEGGGTIANNSGNGGTALNGTFGTGSPTWTNNGKFNKAILFNGTNSINAGKDSSLNINNEITISCWVNFFTLNGGSNNYLTHKNTYRTALHGSAGDNPATFGIYAIGSSGSSWFDSTSTITPNQYHHLVATLNPSQVKLYIDGKLSKTFTNTIGTINSSSADNLYFSDGSFGINGSLDELKIYNYALTDEEIKQDYNQGSAIQMGSTNQTINDTTTSLEYCIPGDTSYCTSPVAEWNFEENTSTIIKDTSGNNFNGLFSTGNYAPTWTIGKNNKGAGINFNGESNSSYIGTSFPSTPPTSYTAEAWIKPNSISGASHITFGYTIMAASSSNATRYPIWLLLKDGEIRLSAFSDSSIAYNQTSGANIQTNKWYHIAASATQNGIATIYVNGIGLTSFSSGNTPWTTLDKLTFSDLRPDRNISFNGIIDDAKIYNYVRTPAQIAYDYNKGGPVGWWKFDECQGNIVNNSSGIGNSGVIIIGSSGTQNSLGTCQIGTSAAWTNGASGKINGSLSFDGSDDYVTITSNNSLNLTQAGGAVSLWFKTGTNATGSINGSLVAKTNGYSNGYWFTKYNNKLRISLFGTSGLEMVGNKTITDNVWHHAVANWTSDTLSIYIDGLLDKSQSYAFSFTTAANPLYIARMSSTGEGYFAGQMDDVRIYNYALTDEQIKILYNGGSVSFQ